MEYFGKAGLNGQTAKLTTVKQVREIGSAVLTCEDLSNWATDTPVFFATYKVDIDTQKIVPNSQINWRGKVNVENNTIIEIQADSDTPDKGNAIGDIVECLPTAGWANSLVDGISVIHKQDGTLKNNVVKGQNIDFASIEDGSIEPGKFSGDIFKVKTGAPTLTPYTWINGKPIYQIYASFNTTARSDNWEQVADLLNMPSDIESIVSVDGGLMISENDFWPVGYRNRIAPTNQDFEVKISKISGKWQARYFTGGAGTANLVIRYTKK